MTEIYNKLFDKSMYQLLPQLSLAFSFTPIYVFLSNMLHMGDIAKNDGFYTDYDMNVYVPITHVTSL